MQPFLFSLSTMQLSGLPKPLQRPPDGIGVGIYMGAPTGLAALNIAQRDEKITRQLYLSWNLSEENVNIVVDQVWELIRARNKDGTAFPLYAGGRVWGVFGDFSNALGFTGYTNRIGVGMPIGAIYQHEEVAIEAYLELAPVFQISPQTEFGFQAGFGVRFFPSF